MAKDKEKGMRSAVMPQEHFTKEYEKTKCADMKYAGEFDAPEELRRSVDALATYVKKNRAR